MSLHPSIGSGARAAAVAVVALALAACGMGAGTGQSPDEVLDNRFARGTTIEVRMDLDADALRDDDADEARRMMDLQQDAPLVSMGLDPDGQSTSLSLLDVAAMQWIGDDLYLRVDVDRAAAAGVFEPGEAPDPDQLASQVMPLLGGDDLAAAMAAGEWIGITDVSATLRDGFGGMGLGDLGALGGLGGMDGMELPSDLPTALPTSGPDDEELQALLEEYDLDDPAAMVATYATVEGTGPWQITIDGAAIRDALSAIEAELGASPMGGPDAADLPDTIGGITLEADGDVASRITIDLAEALGADAGVRPEDLAEMEAADATMVIDLRDWDADAAPEGATTIPAADLMASMGG